MTDKKLVWVDIYKDSWKKAKDKVTAALETGADAVLVPAENVARVKELGKIKVVSNGGAPDIMLIGMSSEGDGTIFLPENLDESEDVKAAKDQKAAGNKVAAFVRLEGKPYERLAAKLGLICDYIIIEGKDWKVIPLENLLAELSGKDVNIIAKARDINEASVALQTLEKGAHGILVDTDDIKAIREIANAVSSKKGEIGLTQATVTAVKDAGTGDRVCIDTCTLMEPGEGMLIGNTSSGLFLIQSEAEESQYVASRPFRVNAGAVHEYVLVGDKTRYLSELASGDTTLIVDKHGNAKKATIGRVKIERRPMLFVEAEANDKRYSAILQNAETIKLIGADGNSIPVTKLKEGDKILVKAEKEARHFGMKIDETIIEK